MKRATIILCALLCMASRHPDRMIRSDINLNVSFNRGDASDRSIYNHSSSLEGAAVVTAGTRYLTTTGAVTDQATIPDSDALSFTDGSGTDRPFSVSCWVYLNAYPTTNNRFGVARKGSKQSSSAWEWDCFAELQDTTFGPAIYCRSSNAANVIVAYSTTALSLSTWTHLVFTYSGSEAVSGLKIYKDGSLITVSTATAGTYTGMSNTTGTLNIGTNSLGGTNPSLNGRTDDLRVYSRELSAAEVASIYSSGRE